MEVVEVDTESTPPSPPRFSVVPARNLAWSAAACAVTSRMSQPGLGPMATGFPRIQHQHPLPHLPPRPLPPSCLELSPHMSPKMHTTAMDKKAPFAESSVDEQLEIISLRPSAANYRTSNGTLSGRIGELSDEVDMAY